MKLSDIGQVTAKHVKTTGVSDFMELPIDKVYPNPYQPRKSFDSVKLEELAQSIKDHGLMQPVVVKKTDKGYMLVAGERRYKAHLINKSRTIKAVVQDITEQQLRLSALIENIQRDDLTDFETATYISQLWASGDFEQKKDLADALGKKQTYISKALGLVDKLDDEIKEDLSENKSDIGLSVLEEISRVKDKPVQKEVYEKVKNKEIKREDIKSYKEPKKENTKLNKYFVFKNTKQFREGAKEFCYTASTQLIEDKEYSFNIMETEEYISEPFKENNKFITYMTCNNYIKNILNKMGGGWYIISKAIEINKRYKMVITDDQVTESDPNSEEKEKTFTGENKNFKAVHTSYTIEKHKNHESADNDYTLFKCKGGVHIKINTYLGYPVDKNYKITLERLGENAQIDETDLLESLQSENFELFRELNEIKGSKGLPASHDIEDLVDYITDEISNGSKKEDLPLDNLYEKEIFDLMLENHKLKEDLSMQDQNSIPAHTFEQDGSQYQKITNIDEITTEIRSAVEKGYRLENGQLKFGKGEDEAFSLDNCYEKTIHDLLVEIEELKEKELYIVSYKHKKEKGSGGGGQRVRAVNHNDAVGQAKEHYSKFWKDSRNIKDYYFYAEPVRNYDSLVSFQSPVSYGFGTKEKNKTIMTLIDGDFKGTLQIEEGGEFVKPEKNKEYKVVVEEMIT